MNLMFCALGIYSRVGGIERFNQRVLLSASQLSPEQVSDTTALVLWDSLQQRGPDHVDLVGCDCKKLRMLMRLVQFLLLRRPSVILYGHILLLPLVVIGRLLRPHARHIVIVHGYEVWDKPNPIYRMLAKLLITRVVSVSTYTAQKMAAAYGLDWSRFVLLPNAIDVPSAPRARARVESNEEFRLLTVARLTDQDGYKGHEKVIGAMPDILTAFPNTHYDIVGEGPLKNSLAALAEKLGIGDHVHFHGYVDDKTLDAIYANAHVFVMPSRKEGFGIVFLEAWKHSLPVIAGNADASGEVVKDGISGLLVDPDSSQEIAIAVSHLLADATRRNELGRNGWTTLVRNYTQEQFRAHFAEALKV